MNEHIKQLALQAKLRPALLLYYYRTIHGLTDTEQEELEQIEKFAELIVKECAGVCHTHGWGMLEHGMSGHNIADDCGTLIKQHFGVE